MRADVTSTERDPARTTTGSKLDIYDPDDADEGTDIAIDGRRARSERSREAMVDALLDLLKEGDLRPSSALIAERAGVTQRTLFNQFGDMDSLISAAASRQIHRVLKLIPDAGSGTLEQRVANYSSGLELLLEETMHVRWAVIVNPNPAWPGARVVQQAREFMRAHLIESFDEEFKQLADAEVDMLVDSLELETDPVTWRLRRLQQELSSGEARILVERAMLALIRDAVERARAI